MVQQHCDQHESAGTAINAIGFSNDMDRCHDIQHSDDVDGLICAAGRGWSLGRLLSFSWDPAARAQAGQQLEHAPTSRYPCPCPCPALALQPHSFSGCSVKREVWLNC